MWVQIFCKSLQTQSIQSRYDKITNIIELSNSAPLSKKESMMNLEIENVVNSALLKKKILPNIYDNIRIDFTIKIVKTQQRNDTYHSSKEIEIVNVRQFSRSV